jgi:hypothetical protein
MTISNEFAERNTSMAENKKHVYPGQLLKEEPGFQVYELSTESGYSGIGSFDVAMVAFNRSAVALRVSRGAAYSDGPLPAPSQVVLSRDDFEVLIASYHAFQRFEKKFIGDALVSGDPFADSDDLP